MSPFIAVAATPKNCGLAQLAIGHRIFYRVRAAAAVVRYGIIDSIRTGGTSSAFAVPAGDTAAWSAAAWKLGHVTQSLIYHRDAAAARGIKAAA